MFSVTNAATKQHNSVDIVKQCIFNLMIEVNVKPAIKGLRQGLSGLSKAQSQKAIKMALNDTLRTGKTMIAKLLLKELRKGTTVFSSAGIKSRVIVFPARQMPYGHIAINNKPINLRNFRSQQEEKGISVIVSKGKRVTIKGAFYVKGKEKGISGNKPLVFAKAGKAKGYSSGKFDFRDKRVNSDKNDLPIATLMGPSIAGIASGSESIYTIVAKSMEDKYPVRLGHYINRLSISKAL